MDRCVAKSRVRRRENDLARSAIEIEPTISTTLAALDGTEGCLLARLCGSGPTCYGLFADARAAEAAATTLRRAHPDWWVTATRLLPDASAS